MSETPAVRDPDSKTKHIDACLNPAVEYTKTTGLERFAFENNALPEVSLQHIDIQTSLVGKDLQAPLMIAPMTGGVERGHDFNRVLARAAEKHGLAMGVGSQRVGLEDESRAQYFKVREDAPTTLLFANIGGAQLTAGWGLKEAMAAVEMIAADALYIHLNPIQEAVQGGDLDFRDLAHALSTLVKEMRHSGVPVFVREVGFGMSEDAARRLIECGVAGIDCSGAGGTSWAKAEALAAKTPRREVMGKVFGEWGIPTARSIQNVRAVSSRLPLVATGGLRSGVDLAKCIALGADLGAMARPMLIAANTSEEALDAFITQTLEELRICMFGIGAADLGALKGSSHLRAEDADR